MGQFNLKYIYSFLGVGCLLAIASFIWLLSSEESEIQNVETITNETATKRERHIPVIAQNSDENSSENNPTIKKNISTDDLATSLKTPESKKLSSAYVRVTDEEYQNYERLKNDVEQSRLDLQNDMLAMSEEEKALAMQEWLKENFENSRRISRIENQLFLEKNFPHRFKQ